MISSKLVAEPVVDFQVSLTRCIYSSKQSVLSSQKSGFQLRSSTVVDMIKFFQSRTLKRGFALLLEDFPSVKPWIVCFNRQFWVCKLKTTLNIIVIFLQVARVAEEVAGTIAKSLPPEVCLQALAPVLRDADFPVNLAALKMTIKVSL